MMTLLKNNNLNNIYFYLSFHKFCIMNRSDQINKKIIIIIFLLILYKYLYNAAHYFDL